MSLEDIKARTERAERFWDQYTDAEWTNEFGYEAIKDRAKLVAALEAVMYACATEQGSFGDVSADSIVDAITEALA